MCAAGSAKLAGASPSKPPPSSDLLTDPLRGDHVARLYREERSLIDAVALYAAEGLGRSQGVVLAATDSHWHTIEARLRARELPVEGLRARGQLEYVPAGALLALIMRDGVPDPRLFESAVTSRIRRLKSEGYAHVRVFGELVDLVWRHNLAAAERLEELWNRVIGAESISLLCCYGLDRADGADNGFSPRLRDLHTHVIATEASG
jgi:hypothetical protein